VTIAYVPRGGQRWSPRSRSDWRRRSRSLPWRSAEARRKTIRYYKIGVNGSVLYTSLGPSGTTDPGALDIQFDCPLGTYASAGGDAAAHIVISGIPLAQISQSSNYNGKTLQLFGGMSKGLPLENSAKQGLLFQGLIQQCWRNWINTSQTLEFLVTQAMPAKGTAATATVAGQSKTAGGGQSINPGTPLNLTLAWQPGQNLGDAAKSALAIALPGLPINVNISPRLTNATGALVPGFYRTLSSFATFLQERSVNIISGNPYNGVGYPGVQVAVQNGGIRAKDRPRAT
jgi:hypothetical protein